MMKAKIRQNENDYKEEKRIRARATFYTGDYKIELVCGGQCFSVNRIRFACYLGDDIDYGVAYFDDIKEARNYIKEHNPKQYKRIYEDKHDGWQPIPIMQGYIGLDYERWEESLWERL